MTFTVLVVYALMAYWVVRLIRTGKRKLVRHGSGSLARSARKRIRAQLQGIQEELARKGRRSFDPDGSRRASWKRFQLDPGQTPGPEDADQALPETQEELAREDPLVPDRGDARGLELDGTSTTDAGRLDIEPDAAWPGPSGSLGEAGLVSPPAPGEPELPEAGHGLSTFDTDTDTDTDTAPGASTPPVPEEAATTSMFDPAEEGSQAPGDEPFSGEAAADPKDEHAIESPRVPGILVEGAEIQAALFAEHRPGFEVEDDFKERFQGRSLRWTGTLDQANSILGTDRVELRLVGHAEDGMERPITVTCELPESVAGDLLGQRDIEITVEGTLASCDPYMQGLRLEDSRRSSD